MYIFKSGTDGSHGSSLANFFFFCENSGLLSKVASLVYSGTCNEYIHTCQHFLTAWQYPF